MENGGSIHPLIIPNYELKGPAITNPSIYNDNGRILVNLRNINYTLYHSEKRKFEHQWGPLVYIHPENDMHLRTWNYLCEMDEILGIAFCKKLLGGKWVQTSYNSNIRKRYAGIGYSYNAGLDDFVPPKPFESWVLNNETADWESPVGPAPELTEAEVEAGSRYQWNEENTQWDLVTPEPVAE